MASKKYNESEFVSAVKNSKSWAQVLKQIGLCPAGGNYQAAKDRAKRLQIDVSHFTGQGHLKGGTHDWAKKRPLSEILVKGSTYSGSTHLKRRLLKEGLLENECNECRLDEWRGQPIPLELDHKNGNNRDHRLVNLRLLCPNCHALTPTWRGRKNRGTIKRDVKIEVASPKSDPHWRTKPKPHLRKVTRPNREELENMIKNMTWTAIGKKYEVSDNAVRKWAKSYGILRSCGFESHRE